MLEAWTDNEAHFVVQKKIHSNCFPNNILFTVGFLFDRFSPEENSIYFEHY